MHKFRITLIVVLSLFAGSVFAQTVVSGTVTVLFASPGNQAFDSRQCTFFQINNVEPWYAISISDPGYESELILLRDSFEFSRPLSFLTYSGAQTCGWFPAYDLYIGTEH
jgi:hypothetical protein